MFAANGWEILLIVSWFVGLAAAATVFVQRRSFPAALVLVAAIVIPVLGSLLAIGVLVLGRQHSSTAHHEGN